MNAINECHYAAQAAAAEPDQRAFRQLCAHANSTDCFEPDCQACAGERMLEALIRARSFIESNDPGKNEAKPALLTIIDAAIARGRA